MAGFAVTCSQIDDRHQSWLTIGRAYEVCEVLSVPSKGSRFRVVADDGTPILVDAALFDAREPQPLPSGWSVRYLTEGVLAFGVAEFLVDGFWERYFNHDPDAVATFDRMVAARPT